MSIIVKKYCVSNITQTQIGVRYIGKLEKQLLLTEIIRNLGYKNERFIIQTMS
jgi:hypothetical protein